jgi:Fic family protein
METYKLPKPDLSKVDKDKVMKILLENLAKKGGLLNYINGTISPNYLYWDKIKYKIVPKGMTAEEFWSAVKFIRKAQSHATLILSETNQPFTWIKLPELEKFLHDVDLNMGGNLFVYGTDMEKKNKYKFMSKGIMEEAIASSQLEGANTTRQAAKKLLLEGRKPRDHSETMIVNNHEAMQVIENHYKDKDISMSNILELHAILTKDTLPLEEQGRLRTDEDQIVVDDKLNGIVYHVGPKMAFVQEQMKKLVLFANDKTSEPFTHPIIKAVMLHFWIAYLHPFTDGNGRLARLLFYWYLLKKNYWAFSYLPISKVIKKSSIAYGQAYLYAEQDGLDLTYFIDYNMQKIKLAISDFEKYIQDKSNENAEMNKLSKNSHHLNDRQIQLLQYLSQKEEESTTVKAHTMIYRVTKVTAIKDLKSLSKSGYISPEKRGKYIYYKGTVKIRELFKK